MLVTYQNYTKVHGQKNIKKIREELICATKYLTL